MMISNLSHEPLSLELIVPHRQDSSSLSATGLEQDYNYSTNNNNYNNNNSVKVAMDPVAFLQKYEQECLDSGSNGNSSFVCLESILQLPTLQPKKSSSVTLHFIPLHGSATVKQIKSLYLRNTHTGHTVLIPDCLEVFIED
jgi:hypothetical protein